MSRLLTPADVAEQLQVEVSTVQGWLRTGRLKGIKLGRYWRIRPEAVEELLAEAEQAKAANHGGQLAGNPTTARQRRDAYRQAARRGGRPST